MKQPLKSALIGGASLVAVAGTVLIPAAAVFADTKTSNSTISVLINPVIALTGGTTVTIPQITPTASGNLSSASDTVSVTTNDTAGYTLTLSASDATNALTSGANSIPASANAVGSAAVLASNTWGFALPGGAGFDATYSAENNAASSTSKWAGMPVLASPYTLKSTSTTSLTADSTTVWYAVKANSSQPSGTYQDAVTYTATTK